MLSPLGQSGLNLGLGLNLQKLVSAS